MQKTAPGMTSMFPHNLQILNGAMPPAGTRHPLEAQHLLAIQPAYKRGRHLFNPERLLFEKIW